MVAIVACLGNHLKLQNPVAMAGFSFEGNSQKSSTIEKLIGPFGVKLSERPFRPFWLVWRPVAPFECPL
jgi:hypothetical protein